MDFGCAAYCKYAEQCLGELSPDLLSKRKDLLKDRVAVEMKKYYRQDFKSINHAVKVARYAEQIGAEEKADLAVLLSASYLHGIACPEGGSEGPSSGAVCGGLGSVQTLLKGLGATEELTEEVLNTITALVENRQTMTAKNAQILRDAHTLAEWQEKHEQRLGTGEPSAPAPDNEFHTEGGKTVARKILLKE
jgi:HD superfamily phosphodiesterase